MGGPALAAVAVVGSVVKGIGQINEGKARRNLYYAKAEEANFPKQKVIAPTPRAPYIAAAALIHA